MSKFCGKKAGVAAIAVFTQKKSCLLRHVLTQKQHSKLKFGGFTFFYAFSLTNMSYSMLVMYLMY